ncbi:MAG: GIY-YIG nuclease family protein [Saprospiraceae bacterium]|nr:GIY-YIG nuclease family protein [Candidatus Brachybacter algidus]
MISTLNIENKKLSGIYCIENLIDSKKYIGSTTNFQKRYSKHLFELKKRDTFFTSFAAGLFKIWSQQL